jgi:hypothetical protein
VLHRLRALRKVPTRAPARGARPGQRQPNTHVERAVEGSRRAGGRGAGPRPRALAVGAARPRTAAATLGGRGAAAGGLVQRQVRARHKGCTRATRKRSRKEIHGKVTHAP